jgi:drug/metabolite transporter (DMT)-like permease
MVLAGGVGIGFAPIGLRYGLDELGPQAIAFWRYVFALPILLSLVFLIERRAPRPPNRFILIAGVLFACDIALWHHALTLTTVSNATFIMNLGNILVGFGAWLFLRQRPHAIWFAAAALAILGAAALSLGGGSGGKGNLNGDLFALAAAFLVSGYILCSNIARRTIGGIEAVFWLTLVEIVVAGLIVVGTGETFMPKTMAGFGGPIFLALVSQVAGQALIVTGLGRTSAALAGLLLLIQPVVAAAVSWQLFEEPLSSLQAAGGFIILFAVWLAQRGRQLRVAVD